MEGVADEEEVEDLTRIADLVAQRTDAWRPARPVPLARVVLDLEEAIADVGSDIGPLHPLVEHVRRQHLLDDAGLQAATSDTAVQTIRILAHRASTRVVEAFVQLGEVLVGLVQNPDFTEQSLPDYGTSFGWAPAASVPFHLYFGAAEARRAFDILAKLTEARGARERTAALEDVEPQVSAAILRLLTRLRDHDGQVEVVITDPEDPAWQRSVLLNEASWKPVVLRALAQRAADQTPGGRVVVHKDHVPQANTVCQVFQAVDAMLERGVVTPDDIDDVNSDRQVNYYKHGARTLGLFDGDNQPTGRALALVGRSHAQRLSLTSVFFEDSPIGRAWRTWAGQSRLSEVDVDSAQSFLEECVVGLTGTTPRRRASTLRTWYAELMPHYPLR